MWNYIIFANLRNQQNASAIVNTDNLSLFNEKIFDLIIKDMWNILLSFYTCKLKNNDSQTPPTGICIFQKYANNKLVKL